MNAFDPCGLRRLLLNVATLAVLGLPLAVTTVSGPLHAQQPPATVQVPEAETGQTSVAAAAVEPATLEPAAQGQGPVTQGLAESAGPTATQI